MCIRDRLGIVGVTTATTAPGMDRQEWVRAIAGAWLVAALISAAIGLVQYFGDSAALTPWVNGTELGEAYGNLRQRNQFATLMACLLYTSPSPRDRTRSRMPSSACNKKLI